MSKNVDERGKLCEDNKCVFHTWEPHTHRTRKANEKNVYSNVLDAIGFTPLIKLNKIPKEAGLECDVYAKVEFFNPGGSIKDRMAVRMIEDAEERGIIKPGDTIIEPTSGNTAIGVALVSAIKGYKAIFVMQEKIAMEKEITCRALGADVVRVPNEASILSAEGPVGKAEQLSKEIPNSFVLNQFANPSNPLTHYDCTAEEIFNQCDGQVDMIVTGAGTGGTTSGLGRRIKELCPSCTVVCSDPEGSIYARPDSLNETDVTFFEIEGMGYTVLPTTLHRDAVDVWVKTNDKISFSMARRIISEEGILAGGSSGAILAGALQAAKSLKAGQKCVVMMPDGIRNYMTKFISDQWMEARHIQDVVNEHNHWWWNNTVADLKLPQVQTIKSDVTCGDALALLKESQLQRIPVKNEKDGLEGVLALKYLITKVVDKNFKLNEPVGKGTFKAYQRVTSDATLGFVSRLLEVDEFVALVDAQNHCSALINQLDVLNFISAGLKTLQNGD